MTEPSKRVVFTMGGKGGVGKTGVVVALAEWFHVNEIPVTLLDLDTENKARGSLKHFFDDTVTKVDVHTPAGLDAFVDHLDGGAPILLADMCLLAAADPHARAWLTLQSHRGLAHNTLDAYSRSLERYFRFLAQLHFSSVSITRAEVGLYLASLQADGAVLSNATMQQLLTVVRLFHTYLMEEGVRANNFYQRPDHCRQRSAGVDAEHRYRHSDGQLEVLRGRRKRERCHPRVVGAQLAAHVKTGRFRMALKEREQGRRSKRVPSLPLDSRLRVSLFLSDPI